VAGELPVRADVRAGFCSLPDESFLDPIEVARSLRLAPLDPAWGLGRHVHGRAYRGRGGGTATEKPLVLDRKAGATSCYWLCKKE
jgi:hypothetical protein